MTRGQCGVRQEARLKVSLLAAAFIALGLLGACSAAPGEEHRLQENIPYASPLELLFFIGRNAALCAVSGKR